MTHILGIKGGGGPGFGIVQPDSGTSPAAAAENSLLTATSSDKTLDVNGSALTGTLDFKTPASVSVGSTAINWKLGNAFYATLAATTAFSMSNIIDGKVISMAVTTTGAFGASFIGVTFSNGIPAQAASATTVYSFIRINGLTWGTGV